MVYLEVGKEILFIISVVRKAMETITIISIGIKEVQSYCVLLAKFQQRAIELNSHTVEC